MGIELLVEGVRTVSSASVYMPVMPSLADDAMILDIVGLSEPNAISMKCWFTCVVVYTTGVGVGWGWPGRAGVDLFTAAVGEGVAVTVAGTFVGVAVGAAWSVPFTVAGKYPVHRFPAQDILQ